MKKETAIQLFEDKQVRTIWDTEQEKWYLSIVDVIEILTGTDRPRKYWSDLKAKLRKEGSQLSEKIGQLRMKSSDGKFYQTDVADTEQLFRLRQSIPSPKAEPFKLWLAQVAAERLEEIQDPWSLLLLHQPAHISLELTGQKIRQAQQPNGFAIGGFYCIYL